MTTATLPTPAPVPALARRSSPAAAVANSFTLAWRSVLKIKTNPEDLFGLWLQPIMYLVLLLSQDMSTGVFDRFRALPIVRWAPLAGAILGDLVRYLISILVTLGFGYVLGFRAQTSVVAVVMGCLLLMAFAFAMCWMSAMLGVLVKSAQGVQWWGFLLMFPLVFGSNILTSTKSMPGWLQAFVKVNPVTYLTEAERALFIGGPAATAVERSLLWAVGIFAVFAPLAVAAYRRRT
jgi:oleandomycin transport system permease protein